jgi:ribosomal protein L37AE/L43A
MNHFVNNAKRSLRRMMGGSIIDIVCGLQILGVVTYLLSPEFFGYLILNPALVVRGQIWRIVTFLAYPPAVTGGDAISFVIFNAIGIYCVRLFGLLVEQVWGRFKFNCYIISGVLLHATVSVLIYLITGMPLPLFPNYLVYSFFFVFALMFPDMQVLFMMLIPLKSSWIAVFEGVMYIYSFVRGSLIDRIEILLSIALMGIFFGWLTFGKKGPVYQKKRSREFQKKTEKIRVVKNPHRCAVCGRTSEDSPGMEFRYCSKCEGSYEYCMDHLYTHKHVKKGETPEE